MSGNERNIAQANCQAALRQLLELWAALIDGEVCE